MSVEDICRADVMNRIKDRLHKHTESANIPVTRRSVNAAKPP